MSFHSLLLVLVLGPPADPCQGPLTRDAVITCAQAASPRLRADEEAIAAAEGEAAAARVVLPANPTASVQIGRRWNTVGDRALNVVGTVSQRIEIGGQRRMRRDVAAAEVEAARHHADGTEREVVAQALLAYYDVLAASEEAEILERASETAAQLRDVARARADAGLGAPLEADLAAAEAIARREQAILARGRQRVAAARLASALGLDPATPPEVRGSLTPLSTTGDLRRALDQAQQRPEVARAQAEREADAARLRLRMRERIPSPSLSVFGQTDGFNERVLGGGLSLPIPLPFPLGRTNRGEIDAARARIREADQRVAATGRRTELSVAVAYHELRAREEALEAYPPRTAEQAEQGLADLGGEIEQGRVLVRDALAAQQTLIELLLRTIESRHALCRASVAFVLAAGDPFEGGAR